MYLSNNCSIEMARSKNNNYLWVCENILFYIISLSIASTWNIYSAEYKKDHPKFKSIR